MDCEFVGFDSFKGFGDIKKDDENPSFKSKTFFVDEKKIIKNIEKIAGEQKIQIIKGFYKDTIKNKTTVDLKIDKTRVVMIDCDLKESTQLALEFIKPAIQVGTIILFDDYNYFKGDINKGEYSAFSEFKKKISRNIV